MEVRSREEFFKQAVKKHKENLERKGRDYQPSYEDINYLEITEKGVLVRLIGLPIEVGENKNDPYSPKLVNVASILDDNGRRMRVVYPSKDENPQWIMWKIISKVLDGKWNKETKTKEYYYINVFPEIFALIQNNGTGNTYDKGWKPSKYVVMNCIDRKDVAWHKENKHTKLLTKKISVYEVGDSRIEFPDPGIPIPAYDSLISDVVEYEGDWENYDVVFRKVGSGVVTKYEAFHAINDLRKLKNCDIENYIVNGPLTNEEMNYTKYDLTKIFKVTSYSKLLRRLINKIKMIDGAFKTSFLEELEELAKKEKESFIEADKEIDVDNEVNSPDAARSKIFSAGGNKEDFSNVVENKSTSHRDVKAHSDSNKSSLDLSKIWKGYNKLRKEDLFLIKHIDEKEIIYNVPKSDLLDCGSCGHKSPLSFKTCPKCGADFEE